MDGQIAQRESEALVVALFTYADRVELLRAALPDRLAWASAVLQEHPPRPITLPPAEIVALEALISRLAESPAEVQAILGVGRAVAVAYHRRWGLDPVIPLALPLLRIPLYRSSIRAVMDSQMWIHWNWDGEKFQSRVEAVMNALLRTAPGRLTIPEAAFCLLGTVHLLSDPTGYAFLRRFR